MFLDSLAHYNVDGLSKWVGYLEDKYRTTKDDETAQELASYQNLLNEVREYHLMRDAVAELEEMQMEGYPVKTVLHHYFKEA